MKDYKFCTDQEILDQIKGMMKFLETRAEIRSSDSLELTSENPNLKPVHYSAYYLDEDGCHWLYDSFADSFSTLVHEHPALLANSKFQPNLIVIKESNQAMVYDYEKARWTMDAVYSD